MIYTEILPSDKQALINGSAIILSKIIVPTNDPLNPTILTEANGIKDWEYSDERFIEDTSSFIGEFIARELKGHLQDMTYTFDHNPYNKNNTIELRLGIVSLTNGVTIHNYTDNNVHWYSLGTFTIMEPTDDGVKDDTAFECLDITTWFNKEFNADYTNANFPVSFRDAIVNKDFFTALELAQYTCEQCSVVFGNLSFTNSEQLITDNQFTGGDSCRDVMKALSKLAYGYCEIGWDDKCYIKEMDMDYENILATETITPDNYYSLKTTNEVFGPVNQIRVGNEYIEGQDGVNRDETSIAENGLWTLDIMDNPILYTQELRDANAEDADVLFGLNFMQFETETIGHAWFKANKPIVITDMNGDDHISYPFNLTIKYNGHIKTTIRAPMKTMVERAESYNTSLLKEIRKLGITVNRQAGLISTLNSTTLKTGDLDEITREYEELISDTYRKEEIRKIVTGVGVDGTVVTKVETNSGTFDENGMTYERLGAKTSTTINEVGVDVKDSNGNSIQFAGYVDDNNQKYSDYHGQTIVGTDNIIVNRYLDIGAHTRIQDYKNGTALYWKG